MACVVERRLSLRHNTVCARRMHVSQSVYVCACAWQREGFCLTPRVPLLAEIQPFRFSALRRKLRGIHQGEPFCHRVTDVLFK